MDRPSILIVGNILRWVVQIYNSSGTLIDADSNPTIAIRKNGSAIGDSVTVTKRTATTGIYDCEYNPAGEVEGDSFTFHETITISTVPYPNDPWVCQVVAVERGTDGANTTTPPTASANATAVRSELGLTGSLDSAFSDVDSNVSAVGLAVVDRPTLAQIEASTVLAKESNATTNKTEILTAVGNIEVDNAAIASAVRVELTDELEIINNIPASFDFISEQIDEIQTVVYVSPAYITVPMSIKAKTVRPFYKDMSRLGPIGYFDSTKTPIDLATFDGDMYIVVEDKETNTVLLYNEDPTYVEHNLYIDPSQESVESTSNNICWALRLISNDKVLMEGPWEIQNAAYGTSP